MAKNHFSDLDTTAVNNSDVLGVVISENCAMANINDMGRATLKLAADFYDDIGGTLTVAGTADAITVTGTIQTLQAGQLLRFVPSGDNTATSVTLNWNGKGAKSVKKIVAGAAVALAVGDIKKSKYALVIYDGTQFILTNPSDNASQIGTQSNLITNPSMQSSVRNGNSAGTTNNYVIADQWEMEFVTSSGAVSGQRIQSATPAGALDRIRISVTTADTSAAAGEYLIFKHKIEGSRMAHAGFGTASASDLVVRFMNNFPSGTYAVVLRNAANDRSYVREFTVTAGTDEIQEVVFPGDTTGTWPTGDVLGATLTITLKAGSTFQTTADAWQAGNYFGTSATADGLGAVQSFDIGDVGMGVDFNNTGSPGDYVVPTPQDNFLQISRYIKAYTTSSIQPIGNGYLNTATEAHVAVPLLVPLRSMPSITATPSDSRIRVNGASLNPTVFTPSILQSNVLIVAIAISGGSLYHACSWAPFAGSVIFSAEM